MDQEMRDLLTRIDERTGNTDKNVESLIGRFEQHEREDREDFHEVYDRLSRVERKQNWMLGVGSGGVFFVGLALTWLKMKLGF